VINEAVKIGDEQGKESVRCEKFAARGATNSLGFPPQVQTAQACLTNDVKGRVQRRFDRLANRDVFKCLVKPEQFPDFGYVGWPVAGSAAQLESLTMTADLFGPDLDAALVLKSEDKVGAKCRELVHNWSRQVFKAVAKEVQRSVDHSLRGKTLPQANSESVLSLAAQDAIEADSRSRIAKAESRLTTRLERSCEGDLVSLFPGTCSGRAGTALDLAQCVNEVARCRGCNAAAGLALLTLDCDGFDNDLADSSCEIAVPPATPTATPAATPTTTPTAAPTATPVATPAATPTAAPTATPMVTPTPTSTVTPPATPTAMPTPTPTATSTATSTAAPSATSTATPTATPSATSTATP
jgi:hypothetical protein